MTEHDMQRTVIWPSNSHSRKGRKINELLGTQNRLCGRRQTLGTGITRTRGLFPFSLVTDHETKAPKDLCTCPQEEVINAAVKLSQKVRLPAVDLDQWVWTSFPPRIPFIISPHGLPNNSNAYRDHPVRASLLQGPPDAATLNYHNLEV